MSVTKLQRALLWHFIEHEGKSLIQSGQKSTEWGNRPGSSEGLIMCSCNVWWGLRANKLIEEDPAAIGEFKRFSYRITEAGRRAAGKKKPEMKVSFARSRIPRWK